MENRAYLILFKMIYQSATFIEISCNKIEHMGIVNATVWDIWKCETFFSIIFEETVKSIIVFVPAVHSPILDFCAVFKLRPKISCVQVAWKI